MKKSQRLLWVRWPRREDDSILYKTEGIVLRTRNLGEADKIVTLYTRARGKIRATARGARRTRNRLLGPTQVFTYGRYLLFEGNSLDTLSQGEIINSFQSLRDDLEKMAAAMYICELVDVLVEIEETNEALFQLISNTLAMIDTKAIPLALRGFELKFMQLLGYEPQLAQCISCGCQILDETWFSSHGGIVCNQCRDKVGQVTQISKGTLALANRILKWDWSRLSILRPNPQNLTELETCMRAYIDYRLDQPLRSLDFISELKDFPV